jgi:ATP-binding cassette subfamily F protein 3
LKLSFAEQVIFGGIDWFIGSGARVGLVGGNGAGKTTLLRVIAGDTEYDGGTVTVQGGAKIGFLPQDLVEIDDVPLLTFLRRRAGLEELTAEIEKTEHKMADLPQESRELREALRLHDDLRRRFDAMGGFDFDTESRKVLKGLGFRPERDAERPTSEFSGGWKMRIALASILLSRPDILLLDEPTNHLDTESMEWLENWLRDFRGTMIAVSHDRRFLEKSATSVAELNGGRMTLYSCTYGEYLEERELRRARLEAEHERQAEKIERAQRFIERFRYKATKASQVQSRIKQLEKMEVTELTEARKNVNFKFPEAPRSGLNVITAREISKSYGANLVFSDVDVTVQRGEKVALVGVNGAGKSTLLRVLNKSEEPTAGKVTFGSEVRRAYFSQESAQNLTYSNTVLQEVNGVAPKITEAEKRNLLGAFLFSGDDAEKKIGILSGGEKSRLALLKMLLSESNLLILDEPTNHLDYETKELFQKALKEYGGTVIIVSHDRYFLDELADRVIEIRGGKVYNYIGNYSWFIEKRAAREAEERAGEERADEGRTKSDRNRETKRREAEERNRLYRERRAVEEKLEPLERSIEKDEARRGEISEALCNPEVLADSEKVQSLMIEMNEIELRLEESYGRWEDMAQKLDEIG